jgi:hypothetical protein
VPKPRPRNRSRKYRIVSHRIWLVGIFVAFIFSLGAVNTHAATLTSASASLSDPRPNGTANYTFTGSSVQLAHIRCVKLLFSDTATGTTVPSGMNTQTSTQGASNYSPSIGTFTVNHPVNGTVTLTNATGDTVTSASARTIVLNGITNASTADTKYWLKFNTYDNTDCASSPVDNATVLFILTNGSTLTLTVDQTLSFTVNAVGATQGCDGTTTTAASTATTIPFGTVTSAANAVVCQDLQAATNATNGYTIFARYTAKPTNALSQTIADHTGTNAAPTAFTAPGTEGYGYTTNDSTLAGVNPTANRFTSPSQGWAAMTTTNAEVAFEAAGVTTTTYRIGHQVGVSLTTMPGTYSTTVIYTCTPVY